MENFNNTVDVFAALPNLSEKEFAQIQEVLEMGWVPVGVDGEAWMKAVQEEAKRRNNS
jgi:hypothetical protein